MGDIFDTIAVVGSIYGISTSLGLGTVQITTGKF